MVTEFGALLLFVTFFIQVWTRSRERGRKFPPGPMAFPILGHLPMLGRDAHRTLIKWRKKYGNIICVQFGSYRAVAIHDANLIRQALNHSSFAGRPKINFLLARAEGNLKGILVNEGRGWTEQRKFASRKLRYFGSQSKTLEATMQKEIGNLLHEFKAKDGQPVKMRYAFSFAVANIVWKIVFSTPLEKTDSEARLALHQITEAFEKTSLFSGLAMFIPWLARIAPNLSGYRRMLKEQLAARKFIEKRIRFHRERYVQGQPRDLLDSYEDEIQRTTDYESSFHRNQKQMVITVYDLIGAGSETMSTTLSWMCLYLLHFPEVQKKLQTEIDDVVGTERVPFISDRPRMPYTEAVIHEVLRYSSIVPFSVFHSTTEDIEFHGFLIPKDTMILPNIYSVHFDENIWGDPKNFRPERFLDDGGSFHGNCNLLSFSPGKRICLGESLARDELFLFSVSLFQTFTARPAGKLPSLEPHVGITLSPQPFEVVWEQRCTKIIS